ncbi:MAG TPA: zf-HC2 domain-containing protein [Thermoanaerobaculia bacterium]|nr:zf-HC2 domain-containing protein [Thermoanaerobaculia bacterium]
MNDPLHAVHDEVEARDLVGAYLAGRLPEAERDAFEAHYFDCAECLEKLEAAEGFREGMLQVAAEDLAKASQERAAVGFLAALALLSRGRRLALAGALAALVVLPTWFAVRNRGLEQQLAEKSASTAGTASRSAALEARLRDVERTGAAERRRLEEQLAQERGAPAPVPASSPSPQVNVPYFILAAVRSGEGSREPVNQLRIPDRDGSFLLAIELATVDHPAYRATLSGSAGRAIWTSDGLRPDGRDTLVILLPGKMLAPGLYRLKIAGVEKGGGEVAVGEYPFRVAR